MAADSRYLPSSSVAQKLFESEFSQNYGSFSGSEMFATLEAQLEQYNQDNSGSGGKVKFGRVGDSQYFIALCGPLMARGHELVTQAGELVLVHAAGGMDRQKHRVYFFVTPTAAGGIPLGVIVSSSEKQEVFLEAVNALKECFPAVCFVVAVNHRCFLQTTT